MKDSVRNTTVKTLYDLAGRPMRKTLLTGTDHTYTGEVSYNQYELIQKFTEYVGTNRTKYTTTFTYDTENKPTALSYTNGSLSYTYDTLNRVTNRTVNPGTAVATTYTYTAGSNDYGTNSTTNLVKTIVQGGVTLTYTYNKNGNITNVSNGTKQTEYVYDDISQLIRVNDQTDPTADSTGTKWVFEYDLGGNITSKKAYKYTTGALFSSISYTYGTGGWKDQLTAYGTDTISYDDIGNPLSDGTWSYTWAQGRQLQSMARSLDSYSLTFEYNEDGLRTKKTSSTGYVSEYTWHGTKLTHMKRNTTNMHFFYDAQGRPAILRYGTSTYGYLYNLQGDVVAIVDSTGAKVVEYTYDAWGKQLSCTGSKASTVGTYQPFRYRGYIYDFESGLYYLRSRYYNPTWGRFINADTNIGSVNDISQHNIYAYCHNSPIIFIDASGRECYICDTGVATCYESFVLSRAEVSIFIAWLDQQYPQEDLQTPFEQVVSNLIDVSSDQAIEYVSNNIEKLKFIPGIQLVYDIINGTVSPYLKYDKEFGTFFTDRVSRDIGILNPYSIKIVLSFSQTADEIGIVYYDSKGAEIEELRRMKTASLRTMQRLYAFMMDYFPQHNHRHFRNHLETLKDVIDR